MRLTLLAAIAIAATVAGASLALWLVAKHELRGQVDSTLVTRAADIFSHSGGGMFDSQTPYEIIDETGRPARGISLPITKRMREAAAGQAGPFFTDAHIENAHIRELVQPIQGGGALIVAHSLNETDKALHRIGFWIFLVGGAGVLVAAGLAAFVAAAALRPVRRLTAAAESVAATGDLRERVDVTGHDELGRLAGRFNAMLAALEESVGKQRQLVADASHELRTPLTAIRTNLDLIREGRLPEEEVKAALAEAATELDELTRLVADLVELARGEERQLRIEEVQLDDAVAVAVERAQARAPQVRFVSQLSPTLVQADAGLLDRAISNLLDNAVKWSPAGGVIEVTVNGGEVVVRDHGPGIAAADLPHVFDRFYRAAAARSKPGSGLGLAIVREAAELHGGTATAESTDSGARFRLTLPAAAA
ncbi:MAG TPA: HAMP domain-containing sensor histidine kinase [Gaiellaceae bacterium]